ncbi:MAG: transposase [Candidatus Parcubacteria bacterium]|nr:transposase [Candidatus Parcubacteria bacterium]
MQYYLNNNLFFVTCRTFLRKKYLIGDLAKESALSRFLQIEKGFNINFEAFSVLSNHYHFLLYLEDGQLLKRVINILNGGISYDVRRITKVEQPFWDKYHNSNVSDEERKYKVMGYILGNPYKHRLVKSIEDLKNYQFSNYNKVIAKYGEETIRDMITNVSNLNWEI